MLRSREAFSLSSSGLPIGIFEQADPQTTVLQLENGDSLLLHMDRISEAGNSSGDMFGAAALQQTVLGHRELSPAPLSAKVLDQVRRFQSPAPQQDDITLPILRLDSLVN